MVVSEQYSHYANFSQLCPFIQLLLEQDLKRMDRGDHNYVSERRSVRANRACATCRVRKQRCIPSSTDNLQSACQRCARHAMPCSFETQSSDARQEFPSPSNLAQMVVELQQRQVVRYLSARIATILRYTPQSSNCCISTGSIAMRLA